MNDPINGTPETTPVADPKPAAEPATKRSRKVTELKAIELILKNLEELPNDGAVKRVLNYVVDHVQAQFEEKMEAGGDRDTQSDRTSQMLASIYNPRQ